MIVKRIFALCLAFILAATSQPGEKTKAGQAFCLWDCLGIASFCIPEAGCALHIDLDAYTMTVYLDGKLHKTFPVSGGANETPSPVGTWLVVNISDWGKGYGGSWIGLNVPWGVYGIHGTVKPWLVGKKHVSHGCIRMRDEDVFEIKQLVEIGSVVHIKHDALPFRNMGKDVKGSDVLKVQRMLANLGFYTGPDDGIFGDGLRRAVKGFQRTYGLRADGVVGRETFEMIVEQEKFLLDRIRPEEALPACRQAGRRPYSGAVLMDHNQSVPVCRLGSQIGHNAERSKGR